MARSKSNFARFAIKPGAHMSAIFLAMQRMRYEHFKVQLLNTHRYEAGVCLHRLVRVQTYLSRYRIGTLCLIS